MRVHGQHLKAKEGGHRGRVLRVGGQQGVALGGRDAVGVNLDCQVYTPRTRQAPAREGHKAHGDLHLLEGQVQMARERQAEAVKRGVLLVVPAWLAAVDLELPGHPHLRPGVGRVGADALAVGDGRAGGAALHAAGGEVVVEPPLQEALVDRRELQGVQVEGIARRGDQHAVLGCLGLRRRGDGRHGCGRGQHRRGVAWAAPHATDESDRRHLGGARRGDRVVRPDEGVGRDDRDVAVCGRDPDVRVPQHDCVGGLLNGRGAPAEAQVDVGHRDHAPDEVRGGGADADHGSAALRDGDVPAVEIGVRVLWVGVDEAAVHAAVDGARQRVVLGGRLARRPPLHVHRRT
mmetsp:Transcript_42129/g.131333  ORF Transcript_42129/g.131333 Transcript_42129/m.131333 type:complete len:347 (-) Transcript_42129:277-1317(-)